MTWTAPQLTQLVNLRDQDKKDWPIVAAACRHTVASCMTVYYTIKKHAVDTPHRKKELRRQWRKGDVTDLVRLHEREGVSLSACDGILQRSPGGCRTKYHSIKHPRKNVHPSEPGSQIKIAPELAADRDARQRLEHASLTAAHCGDPLPGRSALDKRGVVG